MAIDSNTRRYFTVLDESGHEAPAVEYWAATIDEEQPVYEVMPLRRFIKLIGSGQRLVPAPGRAFVASFTGKTYFEVGADRARRQSS